MGVHQNISLDKFPRQGKLLGQSVAVGFNYNLQAQIDAVCVRDDMEQPFITIFRLSDGRHVLATECQYTY